MTRYRPSVPNTKNSELPNLPLSNAWPLINCARPQAKPKPSCNSTNALRTPEGDGRFKISSANAVKSNVRSMRD